MKRISHTKFGSIYNSKRVRMTLGKPLKWKILKTYLPTTFLVDSVRTWNEHWWVESVSRSPPVHNAQLAFELVCLALSVSVVKARAWLVFLKLLRWEMCIKCISVPEWMWKMLGKNYEKEESQGCSFNRISINVAASTVLPVEEAQWYSQLCH